MIALLTGTVASLHHDRVIIDVGGVGYLALITPGTAQILSLGSRVTLHTSMVVREDSMTLYGFQEERAKELFDIVQTVSGIGPKVALSIVSALSYEEFAHAVAREDVALLSQVPGIGKKGAQRLILDLKGKLSIAHEERLSPSIPWREKVMSALISLGFSAKEAESAISEFARHYEGDISSLDEGVILKSVLAQSRRR